MSPRLIDPLGGSVEWETEEENQAGAARLSEIARELKRLGGVKITYPSEEAVERKYYALGDYGEYQRGNPNPSGLMCVTRTDEGLWLHRLDSAGKWIDDPSLADYVYGRNDDSWPISETEARSLVSRWGFAWTDPLTDTPR